MTLQEIPLGNVSIITMGVSPKGDTYNNEGIGIPLLNGPTEFGLISPACTVYTTDSKRECIKGDLIFCVRGSTTGRMNWADIVYSLGRGVCSIHGETRPDTQFIKYCIDFKLNQLLQLSGGSTFPNLTKNDLGNLLIPYPLHRSKIAGILSAYDDLIENNTRRIKILEEMAQTIYNEWFVKFRFPGHENVKMVESELGMIPEGWEVRKLRDVAFINRGKSYGSNDLVDEGGLPFINLKCVDRDGGFRYDGIKRYTGKYKEGQVVKTGDIVMAVTDMTQERRVIARSARVPQLRDDFGIISMDLIKITANDLIPNDYLYGILRYSDFADNVKQYANGANVLHLNPEHVLDFSLALAPERLRNRYSELCKYLYNEINVLSLKNRNLSVTRDLLLPRLISGEIDVSELDIDVGGITA
jgi:type I restriction enzyme S subunit